MQCLKLFTHLLTSHPLRGISTFPPPTIGREGPDQVIEGQINIKGHSAGSYSGMALETVVQSFPDIEGSTILAAIALPPHLLTNYKRSKRTVQLIHHIADRLCVWVPHRQVLRSLENVGIATTIVSGWRAYLGAAQHNYAHWTKAALPAGRFELYDLENIPGVLPFSVYAQAPLRLISWCSFELPDAAQQLLRKLARLCESSTTTTQELVEVITEKAPHVRTAEDATRYLATLTTINIADRARCPTILPWCKISLALCRCTWRYTCWTITCRCSARTKVTMKQVSLIKPQAPSSNLDSPSPSNIYSKAVSLATGRSLAVKTPSHSDTPAWVRWKCWRSWKVMPTTTR